MNQLVERALREGGITVDFDKEKGEGQASPKKAVTAKKSNKDMLNDEEFYDKEETPKKKEDEAAAKKKKEEKIAKKEGVSSVEKATPKPTSALVNKTSEVAVPSKPKLSAKPDNHINEKEKKVLSEAPKVIKASSNGDKPLKKNVVIETDGSDKDGKIGSLRMSVLGSSRHFTIYYLKEMRKKKKLTVDKAVVKKVIKKSNGDDTDELESDSEKQPKSKPKQLPKQQHQQQQPVVTQKATAVAAAAAPNDKVTIQESGLLIKKRRLDKALSNRFLQENTRVEVFIKDPFFEQDVDVPFVSPLAHSKLAFRAVYLNDMRALKALIDDVDRVLSVHIGRSVSVNETPAQLAVQLGNRRALEMLIDDFLKPSTRKRVQMPETMLHRFSTGVYNSRSLGGVPFMRRLTESRGAKEGNQAFTKDHVILEYVRSLTQVMLGSLPYGSQTDIESIAITVH